MTISPLRRTAMLYDLSRFGLFGMRLAGLTLLAAIALGNHFAGLVGALTMMGSIALWLGCRPASADIDRLRAKGLAPPRAR